MVDFTKLGSEIFRDYVTIGVPASGDWDPVKSEIRTWMAEVEEALADNASGVAADDLTTYGYQAGINNGTPTNTPSHSADLNTFIGVQAGKENTTGFAQTFVGHGAGVNTTTGDSNTYIGTQTGVAGTTAKWNVGIGVDALLSNEEGWNCVVIGHHAGTSLDFASGAGETVAIGAECMRGVGGVQCVAIGYRAGYNINASGSGNTMIGRLAGFTTTAGFNNVMLGNSAGFSNVSGDSNIFLGPFAGYFETGDNKLMIGIDTYTNEATARLSSIVYGVMGALSVQYFQVNGGFVVADGAVPTGGNKGAGTINAKEVYNDNVALTCFGVEYLIDGKVDVAKWDSFMPEGRENSLVRRFVEMTEQFDPRNPDQYLARMVETRSLPGMPTQDEWRHNDFGSGELINRLWLSAELIGSAFAGHVSQTATELAAMKRRLDQLEQAA